MAEVDYKDLKSRIEGLIETIDRIDAEATSFADAKAELHAIAGNLRNFTSDLSTVIKTSEAVLDQVNSVAVDHTLKEMKMSSERFEKAGKEMVGHINATINKQAQDVQLKFDDLSACIQKKVYILGGSAVACGIIALICSFIH